MTLDALSDLVLALACIWLVQREWTARPAVALALLCVGAAALLGVARFSGVNEALGPHAFLSMIGATAGLPLLAVALRWPGGITAMRRAGAARFLLVGAALAVVMAAAGFALWQQLAPGLAGAVILWAACTPPRALAVAGALALLAGFAVTAAGWTVAEFSSTQGLHYLMALAFALLVYAPPPAPSAQAALTPG